MVPSTLTTPARAHTPAPGAPTRRARAGGRAEAGPLRNDVEANGEVTQQRPGRRSIRVIIADDHPLVLNGLDALLREHPEFVVVERCATGAETIAAVRQHHPDILLLDLQMPDMNGLAVASAVQCIEPAPKLVLLTAHIHENQLIESLRLGVRGVVLKEMAPKLLVQCLRRVDEGWQWLEKDSASRAMAKLVRREAKMRELATLLTPREFEVTRLAAQDLTNKEIASRLFIAEGTVKIHLHNIYEKLAIGRRAELVRFAHEHGLV